MLAALSVIERALLAAALLATVAAGVLHFAGAADLATFLVSALALAGLAWVVSFATEALGARLGPAATGFLLRPHRHGGGRYSGRYSSVPRRYNRATSAQTPAE